MSTISHVTTRHRILAQHKRSTFQGIVPVALLSIHCTTIILLVLPGNAVFGRFVPVIERRIIVPNDWTFIYIRKRNHLPGIRSRRNFGTHRKQGWIHRQISSVSKSHLGLISSRQQRIFIPIASSRTHHITNNRIFNHFAQNNICKLRVQFCNAARLHFPFKGQVHRISRQNRLKAFQCIRTTDHRSLIFREIRLHRQIARNGICQDIALGKLNTAVDYNGIEFIPPLRNGTNHPFGMSVILRQKHCKIVFCKGMHCLYGTIDSINFGNFHSPMFRFQFQATVTRFFHTNIGIFPYCIQSLVTRQFGNQIIACNNTAIIISTIRLYRPAKHTFRRGINPLGEGRRSCFHQVKFFIVNCFRIRYREICTVAKRV